MQANLSFEQLWHTLGRTSQEHVPEPGGGYELSGPPTTPQLFSQQSSSAIKTWIRLDAVHEDCCAMYALDLG